MAQGDDANMPMEQDEDDWELQAALQASLLEVGWAGLPDSRAALCAIGTAQGQLTAFRSMRCRRIAPHFRLGTCRSSCFLRRTSPERQHRRSSRVRA